MSKKIKFNKRLWKKFLKKRIYGWDVIDVTDNSKIYRNILGSSVDQFMRKDGTSGDIPPTPYQSSHIQVNTKLTSINKISTIKAFLLSRKLASSGKFKLVYKLIIKELR